MYMYSMNLFAVPLAGNYYRVQFISDHQTSGKGFFADYSLHGSPLSGSKINLPGKFIHTNLSLKI